MAGSGILNEITLEEKLRSDLPCYMLPKPIKVPVIPSLVNGKVDRQALLKRYNLFVSAISSLYLRIRLDSRSFVCSRY